MGYSLSCAEYDDLRREAGGGCMVCGVETERPYIDHDHQLGNWAVRGLVCHTCNVHLGQVDAGKRRPTAAICRFLSQAWHARQESSPAKASRVRPRQLCPSCGLLVAVYGNGRRSRHWSRLPGRTNTLCQPLERR
ncbi:endonuclease domain-containing protein [Streptomyces scabiei]|uniref:endonuclease domain-containing protein n=1 Tax=Streptomyces scabiei TaxID=1930 RepID=UPI0038D429BD